MATIEWAQLCELAFLDSNHRLCLIGITTRLPVPSLPITVHQLMIAAHIVGVQHGDELDVEVAMLTPRGSSSSPEKASLDVSVAGEYLLIAVRDIPLTDAGLHRVLLSIGGGETVALDVTVVVTARPTYAEVH